MYVMGPFFYAQHIDAFLNMGALMPDPGFVTNPIPKTCKLIHARIEYEDIANIYPTDVAIAASTRETIQALISAIRGMLTKSRIDAIRTERLQLLGKPLEKARKNRREDAKQTWNASPLSWLPRGGHIVEQTGILRYQ